MSTPATQEPQTSIPRPPRLRQRRGRTVAVVVLLALTASIALNLLLYRRTLQNYRQLSETQLDPLGTRRPAFPADSPPPSAGSDAASLPTVILFGDSRARAWPAPLPSATSPVAGFRFVNRGIGGQTTAQVLGRLDAHLMPAAPDVVVLQAGINDLKAIPLLPHRRDEIVADCKANLRSIVDRSRALGAMVVVTTVFPTGKVTWDRRPVWSPEIDKAIEEVNADLRSLATDGVVVLDAWALLQQDGKLKEGYGIDTLHLNDAAYRLLNERLIEVISDLATTNRDANAKPATTRSE